MLESEKAYRLRRLMASGILTFVGFGVVGAIALTGEVPHPDLRVEAAQCQDDDIAVVAQLKPLLDRTDAKATAVAAQAVRHLIAARSFCDNGHGPRGLELYAQTAAVLAGFQNRGKVAYGR